MDKLYHCSISCIPKHYFILPLNFSDHPQALLPTAHCNPAHITPCGWLHIKYFPSGDRSVVLTKSIGKYFLKYLHVGQFLQNLRLKQLTDDFCAKNNNIPCSIYNPLVIKYIIRVFPNPPSGFRCFPIIYYPA